MFSFTPTGGAELNDQILFDLLKRQAVDIRNKCNVMQAAVAFLAKKLVTFSSRLQEAEREIEDMEITIDGQDAALTENSKVSKALRY